MPHGISLEAWNRLTPELQEVYRRRNPDPNDNGTGTATGTGTTPVVTAPTSEVVPTGEDWNRTAGVDQWRSLVRKYFKPEHVEAVLWIIKAETGGTGDPNSVNPDSGTMGLMQQHPKYWAERVAAIGHPDGSAFNPELNIAASARLLYTSEIGWGHWETARDHTGRYASVFAKDPFDSTYGATIVDKAATLEESVATVAGGIPTDGKVYEVAGVGTIIVYEAKSANVTGWIYYKVSDPSGITNWDSVPKGGKLTLEEFDSLFGGGGIDGGGVSGLLEIGRDWGSHAKWLEDTILEYAGFNRVAMENEEVYDLLLTAILKGWSEDEFSSRLQGTDWWKNSTSQAHAWANMTDSQRVDEQDKWGNQLAEAWKRYSGQIVPMDDAFIADLSMQVASGVINYGRANDLLRQAALENPTSPLSQEQGAAGTGVDNTQASLLETSRRWGIELSDRELKKWAKAVYGNQKSEADFVETLKGMAEVQYGSVEKKTGLRTRDTETMTWASPFLRAYSGLMETGDPSDPGELFGREVQKALTENMSVSDFKDYLRASDRWYGTDNARSMISSTMGEISRKMGMG